MSEIIPVILCGGSGTRLWPASRERYPKQFLRLGGEPSLFEQTLRRACTLSRARDIVVVTNESLRVPVEDQLAVVAGSVRCHVLLEPVGRNTAAACAYAAFYCLERLGETTLWILPSDHFVEHEGPLEKALGQATGAARAGQLVTFGIRPSRAETGYGYIRAGQPLAGHEGALAAAEFIEKPPAALAREMIASGHYLWNSGMFVMEARTLLAGLATHATDIHEAVRVAYDRRTQEAPTRLTHDAYQHVPAVPVDRAVMEKADNLAVVPCDIGWSDVGSWHSLWELLPHDEAGNAILGHVTVERSRDCIIHAESRLVACAGVSDLAVVETPDAILVADRRDADGLRRLVASLKTARSPEVEAPATEHHGWGAVTCVAVGDAHEIREIHVEPGQAAQIVASRDEELYLLVASGNALIENMKDRRELRRGEAVTLGGGSSKLVVRNAGGSILILVATALVACGARR
ncbi:MAG: mannose-1-phosphate guanylyltransferase/mannose-6-phosphate isomerase [Alphaproteobacteria bacterium]